MELSTSVSINRSVEDVWKVITDFRNCPEFIESIISLEVLDDPKDTLVGFKWKETRIMFGKEATETMWITDYADNDYYQTRAESHGAIYVSKLSVSPDGEGTKLTMSFSSKAVSFVAKFFAVLMGFMFKGSMKKAITKDLTDIKAFLESKA